MYMYITPVHVLKRNIYFTKFSQNIILYRLSFIKIVFYKGCLMHLTLDLYDSSIFWTLCTRDRYNDNQEEIQLLVSN